MADLPKGHRCPWCGYVQQEMRFPLQLAIHDYACEHCGKPIKVTVMPHTTWTLTLRKADESESAG
jgi:hypothetical protein